jgi:hypothetical protein
VNLLCIYADCKQVEELRVRIGQLRYLPAGRCGGPLAQYTDWYDIVDVSLIGGSFI